MHGTAELTVPSLNVNSVARKTMVLAALLADLAAMGISVSVIALQETKLDPNSNLIISTDLSGFSCTRKDVKKGNGGVAFLVRDDLLAYEHTEHGVVDACTLWIRVPQVQPPLQIGVTYLSPTALSHNSAHQHFTRIDKVTLEAESAGYAWILVGDFNAPGLRWPQQGAWARASREGHRTPATARLEGWLAAIGADDSRPDAVITGLAGRASAQTTTSPSSTTSSCPRRPQRTAPRAPRRTAAAS